MKKEKTQVIFSDETTYLRQICIPFARKCSACAGMWKVSVANFYSTYDQLKRLIETRIDDDHALVLLKLVVDSFGKVLAASAPALFAFSDDNPDRWLFKGKLRNVEDANLDYIQVEAEYFIQRIGEFMHELVINLAEDQLDEFAILVFRMKNAYYSVQQCFTDACCSATFFRSLGESNPDLIENRNKKGK